MCGVNNIFSQKIHCSVLAGRYIHASSCESGKLVYVLQEQAELVTVHMNAALGLETTVDIMTKNMVLTLAFQVKLDCHLDMLFFLFWSTNTIGFHWLEFLSV